MLRSDERERAGNQACREHARVSLLHSMYVLTKRMKASLSLNVGTYILTSLDVVIGLLSTDGTL